MANKNALRLMYLSFSAALLVSLCAGQEAAQPLSDRNGQAGPGSPAVPLLMTEAPPNPPKVTCKGDQLTVLADNSTLGSVLAAIRACTGVQIDIPEGAGNSRSFDRLGPGPARQVLTALLNGTDFNYVIESSVADPQKVASVLILARTPDKATATAALASNLPLTSARKAWLLTQKNGRAVYTGNGDSSTASDSESESSAQEDSSATPMENPGANATPAPVSGQPPQAAETSAPPTQSAVEPPAPANTSASATPDNVTDEKINSMQQLFEQRRKMTESQNAPAKPQ